MIDLFRKYFTVGIINTAIHWFIFSILVFIFQTSQTVANFIAFCVAVTFSFLVNAKWTFKVQASLSRYLIFTVFMALIAFLIGYIADQVELLPILTLLLFSSLSLFIGFLYSNYIVFRN